MVVFEYDFCFEGETSLKLRRHVALRSRLHSRRLPQVLPKCDQRRGGQELPGLPLSKRPRVCTFAQESGTRNQKSIAETMNFTPNPPATDIEPILTSRDGFRVGR
jgi:hypothetical protein